MVEDIKMKFVIPKECKDENSCSQEMQQAFLTCEQHRGGGLNPQWVHESDCNDLVELTKKDVFVLSEFEGPLFDKLRSSKCLVVGPRCLSCCLTEGVPIPSGVEPMFTVAMRGLIITASGFSKPQKDNIRQKVQWMGGTYALVLTADTTHLVSDTVLSDKYIKSVETGIPVMSESWIEDVWQTSLKLNVNGAAEQFQKHLLPPFANLEVTTSSVDKKEKMKIMKLVNDLGGKFTSAFQSVNTDIVVLNRKGITGDKYKAAVEFNKVCVVPDWVFDSAQKGVALPFKRYSVVGATTSSPLTQHKLPDMSLNFSRITGVRPANNFVDETRNSDISTLSVKMKSTQDTRLHETSVPREIVAAFENLDMDEIKKAGPILDGYCILVCGPPGPWRDRAYSAVVRAGAVRLESDHPRLTHVITTSCSYVKHMSLAVPVLTPMWLIDTLKMGRPVDERNYLIDETSKPVPKSAHKQRLEPDSPMSKRNLQLLRPPTQAPKTPNKTVEAPLDEAPQDLLHYLSQNPEPSREITPEKRTLPESSVRRPDDTEFTQEDPTEDYVQIFQGLTIEVQDLEEDALCSVSAEVNAAGGVLTRAGGGGQYCVVPLDFNEKHLKNKDAEAITVFWIKDCLTHQEVVPVQYYHKPVSISQRATTCLNGVVLSLSTYVGMERAFLDELAKLLGATTQLRFCRRTTPAALASTHLLCPTAVGDKYIGAIKWGLPAVTGKWLLDAALKGERMHEGPYLVGDTKAPVPPPPPQPATESPKPTSEETTNDESNAQNDMGPPVETRVARKQSLPNNSKENTPKGKQQGTEDDMSPASRYIAMARQGLLGADSQETPKRVNDLQNQDAAENNSSIRTPPLEDALSTPNLMLLSPTTRRRLMAVKKGEMPSDPIATPTDPFREGPETPDSGFGAALRPGTGRLSPHSRKRLWSIVQSLPDKQQEKSAATPLSEVKNRFLAQFNSDSPLQINHSVAPRKLNLQDRVDTPPTKKAKLSEIQDKPNENMYPQEQSSVSSASKTLPASVDAQLEQLCATLNSRNCSPAQRLRRNKDSLVKTDKVLEPEPLSGSQPNTVGWDDSAGVKNEKQPPPAIKRFTLSSNVDNREEVITMLLSLGGELCEESAEGAESAECSHLVCAAVGRSEKLLVCLAAGKWVLHPAYIMMSHKAGTFLNEEEYEWGNGLATCLPSQTGSERELAKAIHKWRVARQNGENGPYHEVVALLHVPAMRKKLLGKLLRAGGGVAVDAEPPYTKESVSTVTVCFADTRRCPLAESDVRLLKSLSIPVCPPLLLSSYLTDAVTPNPREHCIPDFKL